MCAIRALWIMSNNLHIFYPIDRISIYWRHLCTRYRKMCSVLLGYAVEVSWSMVPMLRIAPLRLPNSGNTSVHPWNENKKRKKNDYRIAEWNVKKKTENCFANCGRGDYSKSLIHSTRSSTSTHSAHICICIYFYINIDTFRWIDTCKLSLVNILHGHLY